MENIILTILLRFLLPQKQSWLIVFTQADLKGIAFFQVSLKRIAFVHVGLKGVAIDGTDLNFERITVLKILFRCIFLVVT